MALGRLISRWIKRQSVTQPFDPPSEIDTVALPEAQTAVPAPSSDRQVLAAVPGTLDTVATALCRKLAAAEPAFLDLGQRLAFLHDRAGRLSAMTHQALEGLGNDADGDTLGQLAGQTDAATARLRAGQDRLKANLVPLGRMVDLLVKLEAMTATIKAIAKALKMVGLNLNVECARSVVSQDMFKVLVEQIKALSADVDQVAVAIAGDAARARRNLAAVQADIGAGLTELHALSGDAALAARDTMAQVGALMALSRRAMDTSRAEAVRIGEQVAQVVMGIQVHDSLSQRVAHIGQALADAKDLLGGDADAIAGAAALVGLQNAQLGHLIEEINGVSSLTHEAFNLLHDSVGAVGLTLGQHHDSPDKSLRGGHDPAAALQQALGRVQALLGRGQTAVDRMTGAAADAGTAVARLADYMTHVKQINFDIHLKALNAIIHADRLGSDGRAIEVLVQEMKDLANRSNGFVTDVLALIEAVTRASEELKAQMAADGGDDTDMGAALARTLADFQRACRSFDTNAGQALTLSRQLTADILAARDTVAFMPKLAQDLASDRIGLERAAADLAAQAGPSRSLPAQVEALLARYTMDSERHVHATVLDDGAAPLVPAPAAAFGADLGDNVELF